MRVAYAGEGWLLHRRRSLRKGGAGIDGQLEEYPATVA